MTVVELARQVFMGIKRDCEPLPDKDKVVFAEAMASYMTIYRAKFLEIEPELENPDGQESQSS